MTTPVREAPGPGTAATQRPPGFRELFLRLDFVRLVLRGWRDLGTRGRLLQYLVDTDLKRTHADTVMGQVWWLIDPFFSMAIYSILVTVVFAKQIPDAPLFLFAAILPWQWFQTSLLDATTSVTAHGNLIRQIQFPKIILPAASTIAGTITFGFGLVSLALLYVIYPRHLSAWMLAFPIVAAVQYVFTLALAILFSAVNTYYRDVQNLLRHATRIWFYASPAIYAVTALQGTVFRIRPRPQPLHLHPDVVSQHRLLGDGTRLGGPRRGARTLTGAAHLRDLGLQAGRDRIRQDPLILLPSGARRRSPSRRDPGRSRGPKGAATRVGHRRSTLLKWASGFLAIRRGLGDGDGSDGGGRPLAHRP